MRCCRMSHQLCLPAIPSDYDYEPIVFCGIGELGTRSIDAAGRAFFDKYESREPDSDTGEDEGDEKSCDTPQIHRTESRRNKKKEQFGGNALRLSNLVRDENLYEILGVSQACTPDDIKKSYRKLVLERHPDKLPENERESGRAAFLKIQEAFEVLSVDRNRRMYDSSLPFDDTIPSFTDGQDDEDFFEIFSEAFERNSRWSVVRPVPSLGTFGSSKSYVDSFYEFWYGFESWRDFSHHDEYDLSHAESRDERRWMEVQNGRIRKKKIQEESSRVRKLVDLAYKMDPRIRAFKQAELDAIADAKRLRQLEKEAREKEEEMKRIQRQLELEIEAERAKNEKNQIKLTRGQIRQTLGLLPGSREENDGISGVYTKLEKFNNALIKLLTDLDSATRMLERAQVAASNEIVDEFMDSVIEEAFPRKEEVQVKAEPVEPAPVVSTEWTADELQLLTRGMQKFPVGTNKRWEVIQGLIGSSKTVAQVIEMSKIVASKKVIDPVGIVTKKPVAPVAVAAPDVDYERLASEKAVEEWTPEQQKQLEEGMKKFPASLPAAERWTKIAENVDGKTKQQCVARFKYIRELIASKKK